MNLQFGFDFRRGLETLPSVLEALVARLNTVLPKAFVELENRLVAQIQEKVQNGDPIITADLHVEGTLEVDGTSLHHAKETFLAGIDVSGAPVAATAGVTANTLAVSGAATVGGTLGVTGATTLTTTTVNGPATVNNALDVTGTSRLRGNVTADNNLQVIGRSDLTAVDVYGTAQFREPVHALKTLIVDGATTVSGPFVVDDTIDVTGNAQFRKPVVLLETIYVTGSATVNGNASITGGLNQYGPVVVDDTIDVTGNALLRAPVTMQQTLAVTGLTTVSNISGSGNITMSGLAFVGQLDVFSACQLRQGFTEWLRGFKAGEYVAVPYNPADFTGGGSMTITASSLNGAKYTVIGKSMLVQFSFNATCGGTASNAVRFKIPGGFTQAGTVNYGFVNISGGGVAEIGYVHAQGGLLAMFRANISNYPLGVSIAFNGFIWLETTT